MFKAFALAFVLMFAAACSGGAQETAQLATDVPPTDLPATSIPATDEPAEENADEAMPTVENAEDTSDFENNEEATTEDSTATETLMERPAWQTMTLTDARSGETFTLADFEGQTVFVEPMATWCSNCRSQLGRVSQARGQLDDNQHVFIALSLETTLQDADLASYADNQGFNWTFAVLSNDLLRALADEFGRGITSAPSTPHFVIRPDGSFTMLNTGSKSVDQIVDEMLRESEV